MKLSAKFLSPSIVVAIFSLDRITKYFIQRNFYYGETYNVLPFFDITYVENTGVAFGVGENFNRYFVIVIAIILSALFYLKHRWEKENPGNLILKVGLALLIGGALGNLYDRIVYKCVIDFLDFFIGARHWPAFNVADSSIFIGAFLLVLTQWKKGSGKEDKNGTV